MKNNRTGSALTRILALLLLIGTVAASLVGCFECKHEECTEEVTLQPTCGMAGKLVKTCTECQNKTEIAIPATEQHNFGGWVYSSPTSVYRTCVGCGAVESSLVSGTEDSTPTDTYTYTTFSSFEKDCLVNRDELTYSGTYNKIVVSLGGGNYTNSCENKKVIIPARVTDVHFIGVATGTPFQNFTLEFEERVSDINLTFNDVRIESDETIITSPSRYVNFNIKMLGRACVFKIVKAGYDGDDGIDAFENNDPNVHGEDGGKGISAFKINGNVTVHSEASTLEIKGGNGGNGGDGGSITTSSAPHGGDGGDGGDAIEGEELATVYLAKGCLANIQGGSGGAGGKGGKSKAGYFGSNKTGKSGTGGANGVPGCNVINSN